MVNYSEFKSIYQRAKEQLAEISEEYENDLRLEQIYFDEKSGEWNVVISYLTNGGQYSNLPFQPKERIYKKVILDSEKNVNGILMYS